LLILGVSSASAQFPRAWDRCPNKSVAHDERISVCSEAIRSGQLSARNLAIAYASRGISWQAKGDIDRAIADFDDAIAITPAGALAEIVYRARGTAWSAKGNNDRAIVDFTAAIKLNPKEARSFLDRAFAFARKGDPHNALADYDQTIRLAPTSAISYSGRAFVWLFKREHERAISDFDVAIRLDPKNASTFRGRGTARIAQHDFQGAIADFDKAIQLNANDAEAFSGRGIAYSNKEFFGRAIADFNEAIRLKPSLAEAYYQRAVAYRGQNSQGQAPPRPAAVVADLIEAIRLDPSRVEFFLLLGRVGREQGTYGEAIHVLTQALRGNPNSAEATLERGKSFELNGQLVEALADYRRVLASPGKRTEETDAVQLAREGVNRLTSTDVRSLRARLAVLFKGESAFSAEIDRDEALLYAKHILSITERQLGGHTETHAASLIDVGAAYRDLKRYSEAEAAFRKALTIRESIHGSKHISVANALNRLSSVLELNFRYSDAAGFLQRALEIRTELQGPDHIDVLATLEALAGAYRRLGRFDDAEPLRRQLLDARERILGSDHREVAEALDSLAAVLADLDRPGEALLLRSRALSIWEKVFDWEDVQLADRVSELASLYVKLGQYEEAEALQRRASLVYERLFGSNSILFAKQLESLATIIAGGGRLDEAIALNSQALAIKEGATEFDELEFWESLMNLGSLLVPQQRFEEALAVFQKARSSIERGRDCHMTLASNLLWLSSIYQKLGRLADAERIHRRGLEISECVSPASTQVAAATLGLARVLLKRGQDGEAEVFFRRADSIYKDSLPANHRMMADAYDGFGELARARGNWFEAYQMFAKAAAVSLAAMASIQPIANQPLWAREERRTRMKSINGIHDSLISTIWKLGSQSQVADRLLAEAFHAAQLISQSSAADALSQMASRFGAADPQIASLIRGHQDLTSQWRAADTDLIRMIGQGNSAAIAELRKQLASVEARIAAVKDRLTRDYPTYVEFISPTPVTPQEVQALLSGDEALVLLAVGEMQSYVFALTRDRFEWHQLSIGAKDVADKISRFRRGLDLDELRLSIQAGNPMLFDLAVAHDLYAGLFAPVEGVIKDKGHLIVAPSGPLTALPFHLLVTDNPASDVSRDAGLAADVHANKIAAYRNAAWLLKRHAISVLPSVGSLKALRVLARGESAALPMIGFGDPVFGPEPQTTRGSSPATVSARPGPYSEFWRGRSVDREKLARALMRLEDSGDEVAEVGRQLGADPRDIYLRERASETNVKQAPLADFRVVYFATHGLIAGDIEGLGEPALALTLPKEPSELDDGLLTASEIAQLKLNADWVVLSACNTMAGAKPGAEALSGLARAFFYAGSRAILVSHWAVDSQAAARLTTWAFERLSADPAIGRAEALRRAMLAYMDDVSEPYAAYPAFWGPFSVVGEGSAK
jgi:tetratricopeptide (TPR) repeat protein/CHAT domain-containing protein